MNDKNEFLDVNHTSNDDSDSEASNKHNNCNQRSTSMSNKSNSRVSRSPIDTKVKSHSVSSIEVVINDDSVDSN